jgi:hypothetical protein
MRDRLGDHSLARQDHLFHTPHLLIACATIIHLTEYCYLDERYPRPSLTFAAISWTF